MRIAIAERLLPFSHSPGTKLLLSGTALRFAICPVRIEISHLEDLLVLETDLSGPIKGFTIQLDLEKAVIRVWGESAKGYFQYELERTDQRNSFIFHCVRCNFEGISLSKSGTSLIAAKGDRVLISWESMEKTKKDFQLSKPLERLSLGSHKKQDWDSVKVRGDLVEILPHWLRLGQWYPEEIQELGDQPSLLTKCHDKSIAAFTDLFYTGFEGILCPRSTDTDYQGYPLPVLPASTDPLALLSQGAKLIRSLFMSVEDSIVSLLPSNPPEFHCGRYLELDANGLGTLSMEWSKKTIRRVIFKALKTNKVLFHFQKQLKRLRLRRDLRDKGIKIPCPLELEVEAGAVYYFDNFER